MIKAKDKINLAKKILEIYEGSYDENVPVEVIYDVMAVLNYEPDEEDEED